MIIDDVIVGLDKIGKDLGFEVEVDFVWLDKGKIATITFKDGNNVFLTVAIAYWRIENIINIYDRQGKNLYTEKVPGTKDDISLYDNLMKETKQVLEKEEQQLLNTPKRIYDYGEENNWQGITNKQYEILSQDANLARMAVADMQDKGIVVPEILQKFRRYSMSFREMVVSKIAKEKRTTKKVASATKSMKKKAAWSDVEKKQVGALDDNAVGKYNLYQGQGEFYITKRKLKDWFALMDTADTLEDIIDKMEKGFGFEDNYVVYDNELFDEYDNLMYGGALSNQMEDDSEEAYEHMWFYNITDLYDDTSKSVKTNKKQTMYRKAAEEDLDVKLKVQKNKPAGLDTSSPKSLPESIRPLMQDLKDKVATLKETEAELADVKAGLDAKYQKAKDESKIVEKQAEIENLTNNIGKLLFAAKNETFQFQDNLVALTHQTKVVPAKATDKWKFEKVFEKLKSLMGNDNAQKFLDATLNGLQSQATEKTITELNIFSPTQKQMKTSDTSDTNKFIDALKEIYTNLRAYFLDVKKANNIIEEQLATGAVASKKQVVTKKAEYKAEEDVLFEMMEDFEIFTPGEIEVGITVGGRNLETAEAMLFSRTGLRNLTQLKDDLRNGGTDQETLDSYMVGDVEDTDIESKKKVNLKKAKKVKINKKAGKMVKVEMPLTIYMANLEDRAKERWNRELPLKDELANYLSEFDYVPQEYIVVDNYLINGQFADKETWQEDFEDKYKKYNGDWNMFCENEAVFYNDEEACLNLGF